MSSEHSADRNELILAKWIADDHAAALVPSDHDAIEGTRATRGLIVEFVGSRISDRDLFHACSILGRLTQHHGGSPSLGSATMENALRALGATEEPWAAPARAAFAEGYAAEQTQAVWTEATRTWEFPGCAVPLDARTIAIAAGYPEDDLHALSEWAASVARHVREGGFRQATVAGGARARAKIVEALELTGVVVLATARPRKRYAWLPWRRGS